MNEQEQEIIHRQSRTIAVMFVIILLLIAMLLFLTLCRSGGSYISQEPVFCGTDALESSKVEKFSKKAGLSGDFDRGKKLFRRNCAVCHSLTDQAIVGPGLKGIFYRVPQPGAEWLEKYILNSEAVRQSGDPYAQKLHDQFQASMSVFEGTLSDRELKDLVYFISGYN